MIRCTRHNEEPFEFTAELIHFLESLPGTVTFVNIDGEVLVRLAEPGRVMRRQRGNGARPLRTVRRTAATGENHAE